MDSFSHSISRLLRLFCGNVQVANKTEEILIGVAGGIGKASNHVTGNDEELQNPAVCQLQDEGNNR